MSQENVEIVRQLYAGLNSGVRADAFSDDVLATIFDPAIEVQQLGDLAGTSGTFHGYEGLRQAQRELDEALQGVRFEPLDHAANGDLVGFAVKASGIGQASGAPVDISVGHLFELRSGRIIRWVVLGQPKQALEAVGLRE